MEEPKEAAVNKREGRDNVANLKATMKTSDEGTGAMKMKMKMEMSYDKGKKKMSMDPT